MVYVNIIEMNVIYFSTYLIESIMFRHRNVKDLIYFGQFMINQIL
jgi:hypothetical protein